MPSCSARRVSSDSARRDLESQQRSHCLHIVLDPMMDLPDHRHLDLEFLLLAAFVGLVVDSYQRAL